MMFYKETDFKDTSAGKIPSDWNAFRLEELLHFRNGERPQISDNGVIPVFGANGIMGYTNEALVDNDFTLIVGRVGASGQIHLGEGKIWVSDNAIYSKKYDKTRSFLPFLYYLLTHKKLNQFASKTTHPIITQTFLNNFLIHLPPLEEQEAIVGVLGVVDSVVGLVDRVILKTERLKKGLMQTLLTRGIGHKEYKQTPIGITPKTWQIVKLGEVLELCQYGLSVRFGEAGKYRILKMDDIVDGVAIPDNAKLVDLDEKTFSNFRLEKGDILFNRTNSYELVGRTGIFLLDGDYTFASYLIRLRPKKELVDSRFLTYYMVFSQNRLRQLATRAVHQANINATNLQSFTIPVPPLSEQKQIAETLVTLDKKLEFEKKEKSRLERIKQGLMNLLLTGKIRVKVD